MAKDRAAGGLGKLFLHLSALSTMTKHGLMRQYQPAIDKDQEAKMSMTSVTVCLKKKGRKKKKPWRLMVGLRFFKM